MRFVAPILALVFSVSTAVADQLPLNDISQYLNDMKTAEATFVQLNDDGTISEGKLYIQRPGKMRFEYNPPDKAVVMATNNTVIVFDPKSNQQAEKYPLKRTPLSIILARRVDLGQARMVVDHGYDGTATTVTAQDPENPEYGNIQLNFTSNPVELRQWIVNDANGGQTTVILGDLKTGGRLPSSLFDINEFNRSNDR
ncbi:MAG: outer membrane lipoprotein carrier protein LolA [Paracoccaceae bacterium]